MRACWLKWVGRDWSISADYIWLNYSGANNGKHQRFAELLEVLHHMVSPPTFLSLFTNEFHVRALCIPASPLAGIGAQT